ncbi:hypothetical protein Niako_4778 [Niastella koreensis GR20-10]|uniref:Uncharacterized protein n=1 Tax=Niastella koreensis (strain DSM 17620 / KACC 11465 / NBRC 106392 / GR20-10) TaxID=700598 RepID=G8TQ28_NIAKG|nr:hypothetical protein Niako_4778 [Niastella koreensis GR20-10]
MYGDDALKFLRVKINNGYDSITDQNNSVRYALMPVTNILFIILISKGVKASYACTK